MERAASTALLAVVDNDLPEVLLDMIPDLPVWCRACERLVERSAEAIVACCRYSMEQVMK